MKKILPVILALLVSSFFSKAQVRPVIEWQSALGGTQIDQARCVRQTPDGGYIVAGKSNSPDGNVTGNHGGTFDFWIVKLYSGGTIEWQKSLGGVGIEEANYVEPTFDGGYIVAGSANVTNGNVTGNHGLADYWVVKLTATGTLKWARSFGGTLNEYARCVRQTADSGYIIVGETASNNLNVSGNHGQIDCWIVKIDTGGTLLWQKTLGGTGNDYGYSIEQTSDGGYIVGGETTSNNGDVTGNHGKSDCWVVKLDASGTMIWQKALGGGGNEHAHSIQQTLDGGYILGATSDSADGDVTTNYGYEDYWLVKLDAVGDTLWTRVYGGSEHDGAYSVCQDADGGYVLAGWTNSPDDFIQGSRGRYDYGILRDTSGTIAWTMSLGGVLDDTATFIEPTTDGGYIVAGYSNSAFGDISGNHGQQDYWIVKLSRAVGIEEKNSPVATLSIQPNPASQMATISFSLKEAEPVTVKIYDVTGREVIKLLNENLSAGFHQVSWNINDNSGNQPDDGIYIAAIETMHGTVTEKVAVIK